MPNPPLESAEPEPNAEEADDLAPEYRFRYAQARPNRFAAAQTESKCFI